MMKKNIKNPDWYINKKFNPAEELFEVYDKIVGDYLDLYDKKVIVATGLSQKLSDDPVFIIGLKIMKIF